MVRYSLDYNTLQIIASRRTLCGCALSMPEAVKPCGSKNAALKMRLNKCGSAPARLDTKCGSAKREQPETTIDFFLASNFALRNSYC